MKKGDRSPLFTTACVVMACGAFLLAYGCGSGPVPVLQLGSNGASGAPSANDAGASDASVATPCDPFSPAPTTFPGPFGVGRDQHGTLYAAAFQSSPSYGPARIYQSANGSFFRRPTGTGTVSGTTMSSYDVVPFGPLANTMPAGNFLQIGFANGGVTALALGGMYNVAETLTLVGPDSVAGMPVMSLPYSLKYVADAADGRSFVLVDDGVIDDQLAGVGEVVFFGTPGAMREQSATDDSIGDSSGTHMEYGFTMDGVAYKMSWEPRVTDGSGAVKMGDATLSSASAPGVTFKARNPLPQPLAGFTFICTRPTAN